MKTVACDRGHEFIGFDKNDCPHCEIKRLQGSVMRLEHIIAVMKTAIAQAHLSATHTEDHTRVRNGRLEVWCLGDWVDVEQANIEADEAVGAEEEE